MSIQAPHGTCDVWNTGSYTKCIFGPVVRGNGLAVYDQSDAAWKLISVESNYAKMLTADINSCWLDRGPGPLPGQALDVGGTYIISTRLNPDTSAIDLMFTPLSLGYVRSDPDVGIMCAPGARRWAVTGMCYRHPVYGIQGQRESEYLIGRHELWTIGIDTNPAFPDPFYFPADNQWHAAGKPVEFCAWSDRMPLECSAIANFISDTVGASLSAALRVNSYPIGDYVGANTCTVANGPTPVYVAMSFNGGNHDGFFSVQLYVRSNAGNPRLGYAYNSLLRAGIWF